MFKKLFFTVFCIIFSVSLSYTANTTNSYVTELIKSKTDKAVSLINNKNLNEKEKKDKIFKIIAPLFDVDIMSKLTLGRKYWPKLSEAQKERFKELFKKRIKMVYLDRVSISSDLKVTYKEAIKKGSKIIQVPSVFIVKNKNYSVLFKLWHAKKGWKIYDIEVEGISIIRTYRSQFQDILSKGSIDDLFKKLEEITK